MPNPYEFTGAVDGKGVKESQTVWKTQYQLIDPVFLHELAEVLTHGAKKYAPNNWMRGMSWTDVYRAILHHLNDWHRGEDIDPDSGLPHLAHAVCELMFLMHFARNASTYSQMDDRAYPRDKARIDVTTD
jgi:hypothetical protein